MQIKQMIYHRQVYGPPQRNWSGTDPIRDLDHVEGSVWSQYSSIKSVSVDSRTKEKKPVLFSLCSVFLVPSLHFFHPHLCVAKQWPNTSGYPKFDPIRVKNFSQTLTLIGIIQQGLPGTIYLSRDKILGLSIFRKYLYLVSHLKRFVPGSIFVPGTIIYIVPGPIFVPGPIYCPRLSHLKYSCH